VQLPLWPSGLICPSGSGRNQRPIRP
jgi:hypothetical protein